MEGLIYFIKHYKMRVNIFSKEQVRDLIWELRNYYELYDDLHSSEARFDKDLKNIDTMTIDCIMLSLDSSLRETRCLRKHLDFEKNEMSKEEEQDILDNME